MTGYSRVQRVWNRLRTIDLDRVSRLPEAISVESADEFGPLVIAMADATVFPDGSVKSRGNWIISERFGLVAPTQPPTDVVAVNTACAVVAHPQPRQQDLVESVGPRLATLGRARPGFSAVVPNTRRPLTQIVMACSLVPAGVLVDRGAALHMNTALFARLPVADDRDGQQRRFADLFHPVSANVTARVYLESDVALDSLDDGPSVVDTRMSYEQSGSTLIAPQGFWTGDIARLASVVAGASELVLESEDVRLYARFAPPTTSVTVAGPPNDRRRSPPRKTSTSRFDMDAALRNGSVLPRGVEVLSRPDYDVPDTTVDGHRVFVDGKWRAQAEQLVTGQSLGPWVILVRNAIVAPNGSVMLEDGTRLGGDYFGEIIESPKIDGWIIDETSRPSGLGLINYKAFGHGLLQVAPRLDALMQFDRAMDVLVSDFSWDDTSLLKRIGVEPDRVRRMPRSKRHHLVRVPELIVSTHLHPSRRTARADPIWQSEFVARFVGDATPSPSRRIYFARQDVSGARGGCVNRSVLSELADAFGYETVYPEMLTLDEQVELVSSTIDLFGERGSALNWSLFMPSDSQTVLVNSKKSSRENLHASYQNPVLSARGSRYREINAVRAGRQHYFEVDPRALRTAMEQLR